MIEQTGFKSSRTEKRLLTISPWRILFTTLLIGGAIIFNLFYKVDIQRKDVLGEQTKASQEKKRQQDFNLKDEISKTVDNTIKSVEKTVNQVVDQSSGIIADTASKSAEAVNDIIFKSTIGNLIKQVDKLPNKQKEEVKKEICK